MHQLVYTYPDLRAYLVSALASLHVDNFPHDYCNTIKYCERTSELLLRRISGYMGEGRES